MLLLWARAPLETLSLVVGALYCGVQPLKAPLLPVDGGSGEMLEFSSAGKPLLPAAPAPVTAVKFVELFRFASGTDKFLLVIASFSAMASGVLQVRWWRPWGCESGEDVLRDTVTNGSSVNGGPPHHPHPSRPVAYPPDWGVDWWPPLLRLHQPVMT